MRKQNINKTVLFSVLLLLISSAAFSQNVPLGDVLRKKAANKSNVPKTKTPAADKAQTLGDAIRSMIPKMPTAPAKEEFTLSRMQFAEAHWHGLEIVPITDQDRRQFLIPFDVKGVMVDEVTMEATQCGFLAADVVLEVEGYPTPDLKEFLIASLRVQDRKKARFAVWRQGNRQTLTLESAVYYPDLGYANMEGGEAGIPGQTLTPFDTEMFISVPPTKLSPQEMKMLNNIDSMTAATTPAPTQVPGRAAAVVTPVDATTSATANNWQAGQAAAARVPLETAPADPQAAIVNPSVPAVSAAEQPAYEQSNMAWLGVEVVSVNAVIAEHLGLPDTNGVLVNSVQKKSPADAVGLKREDVITKIGRIEIKNTAHLLEIMRPMEPGDEIELTVMRGGKDYKIGFFLGERKLAGDRFSTRQGKLNMLMVVAVFAVVYILIIEGIFGRLIVFPAGAVVLVALGHKFGFYSISKALSEINYYILIFIIGMNFTTTVLREAGFFDYLSKKITLTTRGDRMKIFLFFCLLTYVVSAFMDNIATILVIIPLTLALARDLDFNPKPLIIGEIIASNVGGASTMFGDFPNLLISFSTGLQFHDFLLYETPICFLLLICMFVYIRMTHKKFFKGPKYSVRDMQRIPFFFNMNKELKQSIKNPKAMKIGLTVLGIVITGLIFSKQLSINPAIIAFCGGVLLLFISGIKKRKILRHGGWEDVLFFAALFVMVGAADTTGILMLFAHTIMKISFGNVLVIALLVMWTAAFFAAFMNAGPAATIYIPAIMHLGLLPPNYLFWWALSLGVLAGSSASLYGASGGPLASSIIDKYWKKHKHAFGEESPLRDLKIAIGFKEYVKVGGPIMLMFLVISSIYIVILYLI